ncbi:hypothetical protein NQ318_002463 [Aromia moschata]|uniref:Hflx-type G domain-containing protein n=1 Tax=Aromia moschata TaxID=1265417 RepID=A0AAV8Y6I9_9CUCU|nr:hypothetical protein NQ318_002463 [Aromia moschata]
MCNSKYILQSIFYPINSRACYLSSANHKHKGFMSFDVEGEFTSKPSARRRLHVRQMKIVYPTMTLMKFSHRTVISILANHTAVYLFIHTLNGVLKNLRYPPQEQLEEAVALVKTLPSWRVEETISIPLDSLERKSLFKSGSMERLTKIIRSNRNITAVFVNTSSLKNITTSILQEQFGLSILDRYKIIMQILKMHATSKSAKLQVALAELYYIRRKSEKNLMFFTHNKESLKLMFQNREQKLKSALAELRNQRTLLRSKRQKMEYPVVAVVGYTNAGKTCLIKALTGEESLQPRNQLFATLDVTLHSGILPSGLEVLYVDTVGFISDIPTNLIECFVATLEDAVLSDVILHVEDLSSACFEYKRNHVLSTLKDLGAQTGYENIMEKVIHVGNKCDLVKDIHTLKDKSLDMMVSGKKEIGLEKLRSYLEDIVLKATSRQKITIRVINGGDEIRWLYKNATVVHAIPDTDPQYVKAKVIITQSK